MSREKRLGRGLEALLGKVAAQAQMDADTVPQGMASGFRLQESGVMNQESEIRSQESCEEFQESVPNDLPEARSLKL